MLDSHIDVICSASVTLDALKKACDLHNASEKFTEDLAADGHT